FFADTRVVRARLDDDPSFRALVSRARAEWLALAESGEVPFDALVQALGAARDRARNPLFQTMFVLHNWPPASARARELRVQPGAPDPGPARLAPPLSLYAREGGCDGWLEYDSDLFAAATVERLAKSFGALLSAATQNPDQPVSRLALGGDSTLLGAPA